MPYTVFYMNRRATEEVCQIIREHLPPGWTLTTPTADGDYSAELASCDFILVADEAITAEHISATKMKSQEADRKSTRLNSSHLVISYAVFCLKKKKKSRSRDLLQS